MFRLGILLLPLLSLVGCQSPGPTDLIKSRPIAATVPEDETPSANRPPLPKATKVNLRFTVQPSRSTAPAP